MIHYSETARCTRCGSDFGARRVTHLSAADKAAKAAGAQLRMRGCPPVKGCTERVIINISGRYYARMP